MYTLIPIINSSMFLLDIGGAIKDFFSDLIENYVFAIFYYIEIALLYAMKLIENMMMIFTGETPIMYNGDKDTLINIFFSHDSVRGVYIGIGMVGIIFAFGFAVVSVVRKMFDSRGKYQSLTMGAILGNLLKSVLLILGMNAMDISYVTGFGDNAFKDPHNRVTISDDIERPIPGELSGGPCILFADEEIKKYINAETPAQRCYLDHHLSYSSNEITIYWNSSLLFATAYFDRSTR